MYAQLIRELEQVSPITRDVELNVTNLLSFPPAVRQFITWIMRQKLVQVNSVTSFLDQDEPTSQALMDLLVQKGLVEEERSAKGLQYQVPVRSSRNYRVPERIWKALDE
ncbi:hypothetical protein LARV_01426 [Longilinea arvoryzae]|uniref:Uncharacterized protein n=1 Tax=Longilinea arvoryzae TaxID=360412 RepID=A0A0S7B8J9_9CHLR|nr:hypothetical protein [Longilinea arvoryzae]GAP13671.1 hypothetical protein LARV_01426 [Longilinea arvoryzae]